MSNSHFVVFPRPGKRFQVLHYFNTHVYRRFIVNRRDLFNRLAAWHGDDIVLHGSAVHLLREFQDLEHSVKVYSEE